MNNLIKQDIGFLEHPLWMQNLEQDEKGFTWKDMDGYIYKSAGKAPTQTDGIFLYYLLQRSQKDGWNNKLELSRYEILKGCGFTDAKKNYNRLMESMERWWMLGIGFNGTFYNGEKYETLLFNIIDDVELPAKKGSKLKITFSEKWLYKIKESKYYKLIDFEELKVLKTPLATRLYEILSKTFKGRNEWAIDAHKLANKIPMNEKYLTHIIAKIQPAVKRITQKTNLHIELEVRKKERGKAVLVFRRTNEQAEITKTQNIPEQQLSLSEWANSPENRMKTIGKSDSEIRAMMKKTK